MDTRSDAHFSTATQSQPRNTLPKCDAENANNDKINRRARRGRGLETTQCVVRHHQLRSGGGLHGGVGVPALHDSDAELRLLGLAEGSQYLHVPVADFEHPLLRGRMRVAMRGGVNIKNLT